MVRVNNPADVYEYSASRPARGYTVHGKRAVKVTFGQALWDQISAEAKARGWPFARMVRFLCEASIEGIE